MAKPKAYRVQLSMLCLLGMLLLCGHAIANDFHLQTNLVLPHGGIWSIPVYDGQDVVYSAESNNCITAAKYDLDLNQVGGSYILASTNDTAGGDGLADHKHVFQNDHHYVAFSTSGTNGSGGFLYLLKADTNFNRIGIVNVVSNNPPTNDMLLFGDGANALYLGCFEPGIGHEFYKYDGDLNLLTNFPVGGMGPGYDDRHANGSLGFFYSNQCHLVVQRTMEPTDNEHYYRISFDTNGLVSSHREIVMSNTGTLSLVTGASVYTNENVFMFQYMMTTNGDQGADLYNLTLAPDMSFVENSLLMTGAYHRPHSVIVEDNLFLGYDTHTPSFDSLAAKFIIGPSGADSGTLAYWDFQTATNGWTLGVDTATNNVSPSFFDLWNLSANDVAGSGGTDHGIGGTGWNVTDDSRYFVFTLIVTGDYQMAISTLQFEDQASAGGPTNWFIRSSADNFASDLATGGTHLAWTTNTIQLRLDDLWGTNQFRIYGQNASTNTGEWAFDNVYVTGFIKPAGWGDLDGDGIDNEYEDRHFGSYTQMVGVIDYDGDGVSSYNEYVADTIALHAEKYFEIDDVSVTGNVAAVSFEASVNRQYALEASTNLLDTSSWSVVSGWLSPTGSNHVLLHTNTQTRTYYRVNVSPLPTP